MARQKKVDVNTVVDAALDVFEQQSYVVHPLAMEQLRDAVQVLLRGLGQTEAADRWISLPTEPGAA